MNRAAGLAGFLRLRRTTARSNPGLPSGNRVTGAPSRTPPTERAFAPLRTTAWLLVLGLLADLMLR